MRRTTIVMALAVLVLGVTAGAVLASGAGRGDAPPDHAAVSSSDGVKVVASDDHGEPSPGYADDDNIVDTIDLDPGSWKITGTGAVQVADTESAPNCGLRMDDGGNQTMLGKQNFATGEFVGRSGFAVVGAAEEIEDEVEVHLVCYGAGNEPFEHNLVAIGG